MNSLITTQALPPTQRLTAYRSALRQYCASLSIDSTAEVVIDEPEALDASIDPVAIGRLVGAVLTTNASRTMHTTIEPAFASGHLLYLILRGELEIASDDYAATLAPGDMAFLRPTSSVEFAHRDRSVAVALFLPAQQVAARACGRRIDLNRRFAAGGVTACLGALIQSAVLNQGDLSAEDGALLQNSLIDAVVHLGQAGGEAAGAALTPRQAETLQAIQKAALRLLDDPDLSPPRLARETGVPVRTLYRLFQASGATFRTWLRDRRLARCRIELTDALCTRDTVTTIAFRWGFNDLTTFGRSFRERYGVSPRELRTSLSG